jgi:hypothetical protein
MLFLSGKFRGRAQLPDGPVFACCLVFRALLGQKSPTTFDVSSYLYYNLERRSASEEPRFTELRCEPTKENNSASKFTQ